MKFLQPFTVPALLLVGLLLPVVPALAHTYDLRTRDQVTLDQMLVDLSGVRLVFIGEQHDSLAHHEAQRQIIQGLLDRGVKLTIALEMFRQDSQPELDEWVDGQLPEGEFLKSFNDNWSMWPVYRKIFLLARNRQVPMLGLNTDRALLHKVSSQGYASLTQEDLAKLPPVACDVDQEYQRYMKKALGGHHHIPTNFQFFCEAQIVWDTVMALKLIEQSRRQPDRVIVVLAGTGHAWKHGIPEQVRRRSDLSFRVVLPEIPGRSEFGATNDQDTDYLLIGVGEGPLH